MKVLKALQRFKQDVLLKKFTKLLQVQMMIKECDHFIYSIETYQHGISSDLIWKKKKIEGINIIEEYIQFCSYYQRRHKRSQHKKSRNS